MATNKKAKESSRMECVLQEKLYKEIGALSNDAQAILGIRMKRG
jgi:hypothetical protein